MGHKIYETKAAKPPTKPISHVCQGAQKNLILKLQKILTNPISHAMGHEIYNIKANKKPISHAVGQRFYNIKASKTVSKPIYMQWGTEFIIFMISRLQNTDKSHSTCNGAQNFAIKA